MILKLNYVPGLKWPLKYGDIPELRDLERFDPFTHASPPLNLVNIEQEVASFRHAERIRFYHSADTVVVDTG